MKRKPWKREVRCLYLMLLKNNGRIIDINKTIGYYNQYDDLIRSKDDPDFPQAIKSSLVYGKLGTKMPQYLQWSRKFLAQGFEEDNE